MDQQEFQRQIEASEDSIIQLERKLRSMKVLTVSIVCLFISVVAAIGFGAFNRLDKARRQNILARQQLQEAIRTADAAELRAKENQNAESETRSEKVDELRRLRAENQESRQQLAAAAEGERRQRDLAERLQHQAEESRKAAEVASRKAAAELLVAKQAELARLKKRLHASPNNTSLESQVDRLKVSIKSLQEFVQDDEANSVDSAEETGANPRIHQTRNKQNR